MIDKSKTIRSEASEIVKKLVTHENISIWKKCSTKFPPIQTEEIVSTLNKYLPEKMDEERPARGSSMTTPLKMVDIRPVVSQINTPSPVVEKPSKHYKPNESLGGFGIEAPLPFSLLEDPVHQKYLINFDAPTHNDVLKLEGELRNNFGEVMLEKLKSDDLHKLNDVLVGILLISRTNYQRYESLLHLMYSWVYCRAFECMHPKELQLYSRFVLASVDRHSVHPSTGIDYIVPICRIIQLLFTKLSEDGNAGGIFLEEITDKVSKSILARSLFSEYAQQLEHGGAVEYIGSKMLSKVARQRPLFEISSIAVGQVIRKYIARFHDNIDDHFISDFVRAIYEKHGHTGLKSFNIEDLNQIRIFIDIAYPSADRMMLTIDMLERLAIQLQSENLTTSETAVGELFCVLEDDLGDAITEVRRVASTLTKAITILAINRFSTLSLDNSKQTCLALILRLSTQKKFLSCVSEESLTNLIHCLAGVIVKIYDEIKNGFLGISQDMLNSWRMDTQKALVNIIKLSEKETAICSLLELYRSQNRETIRYPENAAGKSMFLVFKNLLINMLKEINLHNIDAYNPRVVLNRIMLYLEDFGDDPDNTGSKAIKTVVSLFIKILADESWKYLIENESKGCLLLKNWMTSMLKGNEHKNCVAGELIDYVRNSEMQEVKENILQKFGALPPSKKNEYMSRLSELPEDKRNEIEKVLIGEAPKIVDTSKLNEISQNIKMLEESYKKEDTNRPPFEDRTLNNTNIN